MNRCFRLTLVTVMIVLSQSPVFCQEGNEPVASFSGPVSAIVWMVDFERMVVGAQEELGLLDRNGISLGSCKLPIQQITSMVVSADGKTAWAAGGSPGFDGQIVSVDLETLEIGKTFDLNDDVLSSISLSPDGKRIATASIDQDLSVMELDSGSSFRLRGHSKAATGVAWIDDRLVVSVAEDMSVRVWDSNEKNLVRTMNQHVGTVLGVMFLNGADSPQPVIATWGKDRTVRFWQPTIGRMMRFATLEGVPLSACWDSRDGVLIVGDSMGLLSWIDWRTGKILKTAKVSDDWVVAVAQQADSRKILAGTSGGELWIHGDSGGNDGK